MTIGAGFRPGEGPGITVVGGANMDIGAKPFGPLSERDSNPGRVRVSVGGVGRNIAHNLRLLGLPVAFLTALGKDAHGDRIASECAMAGMACDRILRTHEEPTSTYLFISDETGDMRLAVSDMEICRCITPEYLAGEIALMESSAAVVLDANLPEESIRFLGERLHVPLFADPVSTAKAGRLRSILGKLHTLKPNLQEAELLSRISIRKEADLARAADALLATGLRRVFISLGREGVYAAWENRRIHIPCCPAAAVNMTGAGDAMMAGLVWAFTEGLTPEDSARAAAAAAAVAVESARTVNPDLCPEAVRSRMARG